MTCLKSLSMLLVISLHYFSYAKGLKYSLTQVQSASLISTHNEFKSLIECGSFCLLGSCQAFVFDNLTGCHVYDVENGHQSLKLYVSESTLNQLLKGTGSIEFLKSSNKILLVGGPSITVRSDYFEYVLPGFDYVPIIFDNYEGGGNSDNPATNGIILNLDNVQKPCSYPWQPLDEFHENGAGYGLLENRYPIFCGGASLNEATMNYITSDCAILGHESMTSIAMDEPRFYPGSVMYDEHTLWIAGGAKDTKGTLHDTSIFVTLNGFTPGPKLPWPEFGFCFLQTNKHTFAMVNNNQGHIDFFDVDLGKWNFQSVVNPLLRNALPGYGCAFDFFDQHEAIFIGGGGRKWSIEASQWLGIYDTVRDNWIDTKLPKRSVTANFFFVNGLLYSLDGAAYEYKLSLRYANLSTTQLAYPDPIWTEVTAYDISRPEFGMPYSMRVPENLFTCS